MQKETAPLTNAEQANKERERYVKNYLQHPPPYEQTPPTASDCRRRGSINFT